MNSLHSANDNRSRELPGKERKVDSKKWSTVPHPEPSCPVTAVVADSEDSCLASAICYTQDAPEMARRIAACLNACASVTTEDLEIIADAGENFTMVRQRFVEERDRLLGDLQLASETLRRYEVLHRAKNTEESTAKAEVNAGLASRFEATIAAAKGGAA